MQPPQSVEEIKAGLETTEKGGVRQSIRNCLTAVSYTHLKGVPVCLSLLSWAHAPFRRFHYCRLTGLYHTFRNRGNLAHQHE